MVSGACPQRISYYVAYENLKSSHAKFQLHEVAEAEKNRNLLIVTYKQRLLARDKTSFQFLAVSMTVAFGFRQGFWLAAATCRQ